MLIWTVKVLVITLAIGIVSLLMAALVYSVRRSLMKDTIETYVKTLVPEIEKMTDRMTRNTADALIDSIKKFEKMEDEHVNFN